MTKPDPELLSFPGATIAIYRNAPSWNGARTAAIGGFSCTSADAGRDAILSAAATLRSEGFGALIGPMDGDTWHRYRVVTESDGSAPYFLEPVSGAHDSEAFRTAGFSSISSYVSARASLDDATHQPVVAIPGITITPWDGQNASQLTGGLFEMSKHAFAGNAFYKPITREAFLALYQPILAAIDPRLVMFARDADGTLAGYLFAIPDRLQGAAPATGIIKTYASTQRGVGRMLVDAAHRTMKDLGYRDVIHALMHTGNQSRERSARHHGQVFRRYDLMGRTLEPGSK